MQKLGVNETKITIEDVFNRDTLGSESNYESDNGKKLCIRYSCKLMRLNP